MSGGTGKIIASALAAVVLSGAGYLFAGAPSRVKPRDASILPTETIASFHVKDRAQQVGELRAPHSQNAEKRGFLNLHDKALDCSVCHLEKAGASVGKGGDGKLALLAAGSVVTEKDAGAVKRLSMPLCSDCHRRGSRILADNYYGQRLRVLEDLSILTYLGKY